MANHKETEVPVVVVRKRAANKKSKTGCLTCKIRRVKCDEARPSCYRCLKFGIECDWKPVDKSTSMASRARVLLPKSQSSQTMAVVPFRKLFKNGQEQRYFRVFCDRISHELSGLFDSDLWSRAVLQACESEPGIRHIVVALGALGQASKIMTSNLPLLSNFPSQSLRPQNKEAQTHHNFALKQYGTAIRLLRKEASEPNSDVRIMLLGCLLTICFETFHGDHRSAIAQIRSGLKLVEDWQLKNTNSKDTTDILGTTSPSPYTIEDELIQALGRLDIQAMSFLDPRDAETHDRMRHYGQASIDAMPNSFRCIKEARIYLELVMRRLMHFASLVSSHKGMKGCLRNTSSFGIASADDQIKHKEELERWHRAFLPLLEYVRKPQGHRYFLAATALETHYLSCCSALDVSFDPKENTEHRHKIFTEIVSLCRSIIKHPDVRHTDSSYSFDLQIITPLYIVGMRSRHSDLRKEAIELILSCPRREGVWDSIMVSKILKCILVIEEEEGLNSDSTLIGPGVLDLDIDFDLQIRRAHVKCLQPKSGVELPVEREEIITW